MTVNALAHWPKFENMLQEHPSLTNKRVLVRVDFNVPMNNGQPADLSRLRACVPTVQKLLEAGAIVILISHLGSPKHADAAYSLQPMVRPLSDMLGKNVFFNRTDELEAGDVSLLENTRFHPGDVTNDASTAQMLAQHGDLFVFDAFSVAHREHASTCGIMNYLPTYFGLSFQNEIESLDASSFKSPVVAVVGGAKISTKLNLLTHFIESVQTVVVGGGMANTFLAAQGYPMGHSLYEPALIETAQQLMTKAQQRNCKLVLPVDVVVERASGRARALADQIEPEDMALDIGPDTLELIFEVLKNSKTLIWNGPLGAFEMPGFDHGTVTFMKQAAQLTEQGSLYSIAGGGDTLYALNREELADSFSYISNAGGAFLAYLAGETLPVFKNYQNRT